MDEIKDVNEIIELLESKQYTVLRQRLSEMNEADVAAVLEELKESEMLKIFRILPKDIAADVSQYAVLADDQQYSVFIFNLYESYIRHSVQQIEEIISEETANVINGLADELHGKSDALSAGYISEVTYIEDCLWISLEAMIKLIACTAYLSGDQQIAGFAQALASYAFEYGRMMLYSRELEIVNQFIESQYQLDAELEQKYVAYLEDLQKESQQFYTLIDNAFAPNFRDAFLHSILLAKAAGVKEEEILSSAEDIDSFFLD